MKSFFSYSTALLLAIAAGSAAAPAAAADRTWSYLTSGNGHGFQVYDTNEKKIIQFLDHPYRYVGPKPDPKSDGWPRRNLAFDVYFGLRGGGASGWLNKPSSAGEVEFVDQTNIIHAPTTLGSASADSYFFAPFDFDGNMMVAVLHATGASDGYILLNFHMGGTAGQPESNPPSNGESVSAAAGGMGMIETGPGGGAMVYVPLGGADKADCQGVYDKANSGQDLGSNTSCSGSDIVPGFQKALADGWMAVGIGFTENAGDAANMAQKIADWGAGRAPDKILEDARVEWNTWRKEPPKGVLCAPAQLLAWRQSEAILRMAEVREPYGARKNHGMMLASLPIGEWHSGWVRDGTFGIVGLARSGHVQEAKEGVEFFLDASPVGKYKSYVSNADYRISVVRYFGTGEEEADYSGQPTPNVETDGWGMSLWAARAVFEALGTGGKAWLDSPTKLGPTVYQALVNGIAKPMEQNLEANGIMKADSGIWEVHDANKKHFAFTTMSAARGFCDLAAIAKKAGNDADHTKYAALAKKVREAFLASFVDQKGALGGSTEEISANQALDGAVAAAFTWNILSDFKGATATSTLSELEKLSAPSGGYKRNDDGLSSYDNNEWILVDLLISNAYRRNGNAAKADSIVKLVLEQASVNYYLIPELYNAVPTDGAIGKYTGSIPMVGYGAGAYIMTMLDRAGILEANDCGDGAGATQPENLCEDVVIDLDAGVDGGDIFGLGDGGTGGPGDGPGADVPYGTGACLCRAGGSDEGTSFAALSLLGGAFSLLTFRRRATRRRRAKAR